MEEKEESLNFIKAAILHFPIFLPLSKVVADHLQMYF